MSGKIWEYLIVLGFFLVAAGPFLALFFLALHYKRGTPLPAKAVALLYLGCLLWIGIIAGRSALVPAWRPFIGLPIIIGIIFGLIWERRATPLSSSAQTLSNVGVFTLFGIFGFISLSGGYFDRVFQVPHALSMVRKSGVKMDDPAALARALRDDDLWVRWGAALTLEGMGRAAAPALDALVGATEDDDPRVGHFAWNAIHNLGLLAAPAAPAIAALLKKSRNDWEVQRFFEAVGPEAQGGVPALLTLIDDPSPRVRGQALVALGYVGPTAKAAALPALARIYKNEKDASVKEAASRIHPKLGIANAEWEQAILSP